MKKKLILVKLAFIQSSQDLQEVDQKQYHSAERL